MWIVRGVLFLFIFYAVQASSPPLQIHPGKHGTDNRGNGKSPPLLIFPWKDGTDNGDNDNVIEPDGRPQTQPPRIIEPTEVIEEASKCNLTELRRCENGKSGVDFVFDGDPCNYYRWYGSCLAQLKPDCKDVLFYSELHYFYKFNGDRHCPFLFEDDQKVPGCDKPSLFKCNNINNMGRRKRDCEYYKDLAKCLDSFEGTCREYNRYQESQSNWRYDVSRSCPELLGCNMTKLNACWQELDVRAVNEYEPSTWKSVCGPKLDEILPCMTDQMYRCSYDPDFIRSGYTAKMELVANACSPVKECDLAAMHQCAEDHYSKNVALTPVPSYQHTKAICRNHQSFLNCANSLRQKCLPYASKLKPFGPIRTMDVVERIEMLTSYVTIICGNLSRDIMTEDSNCYYKNSFELFVCETDRIPMHEYASPEKRCESFRNMSDCLRYALDSCDDKAIELAVKLSEMWESELLRLSHKVRCHEELGAVTLPEPTTPLPTKTQKPKRLGEDYTSAKSTVEPNINSVKDLINNVGKGANVASHKKLNGFMITLLLVVAIG